MVTLTDISDFGAVGAEDDTSILDYFLSTPDVEKIAGGSTMLVLGRKGSGKTAIVKYFATQNSSSVHHVAVMLRDYPWNIHAQRKAIGSSAVETYVSSWRYFIAVQTLSSLLARNGEPFLSAEAATGTEFLKQNFSALALEPKQILTPNRIKIKSGATKGLLQRLVGNEIIWEPDRIDMGPQIDSITDTLLRLCDKIAEQSNLRRVFLHFDELDLGLHRLDDNRREILTGLVVAARSVRNYSLHALRVNPIVYLRTDIWDQLEFADKTKMVEQLSLKIEWTESKLREMVDLRIAAKTKTKMTWADLDDGVTLRGKQAKWGYIVARSFMRPRDIISYLNYALKSSRQRDAAASKFSKDDIYEARSEYSGYLRNELSEELGPHWPH